MKLLVVVTTEMGLEIVPNAALLVGFELLKINKEL